ncbi:glycosyltransferase family 4 protein [Nitrospirota bacterium]
MRKSDYIYKTMHVTPAAASLEVLLKSRLCILMDRGYEVVGFSSSDGLGKDVDPLGIFHVSGFKYIESNHLTRKFNILSDIKFMLEAYIFFRKERPDIVNTYGPKPGVFARIAAGLARVPVVVHTSWGLYFTDKTPWYKKFPIIAMERISSVFCDYIFSVNKDDLALMKKYRFLPNERIGYLGNATDLSSFDPANVDQKTFEDLKAELEIPAGALVVGISGRLTYSKGYREFIAAAREIKKKSYNVVFVAFGVLDNSKGDGVSLEEINALEDEGVLIYGGMWPQEKMPVVYSIFDIVVLPSYREGFPRTLVEAAAMAKPLVSTDTRGCREAVDEGENGFLVPVGDSVLLAEAIEKLLKDKQLRERFGVRSRLKALNEYDEKVLVGKVINVYKDYMPNRKS